MVNFFNIVRVGLYTQVHFNVTTVLQPPQGLLFDRGFLRNYCTDLDALWCQIRVWSQLATHQRATKSDHKQLRNQHGENDVQNGKKGGIHHIKLSEGTIISY